jgi:prolipoprotein diacylglyceryltransferase
MQIQDRRVSFGVVIFYGIDSVLVEIGQIRLWYYGLVYAIGLLAVNLWVWLKRERLGFDGCDVAEFSLLFAAGVLLGGRIFDVALSTSIVSLVDTRLLLLALYCGLDAAGVG